MQAVSSNVAPEAIQAYSAGRRPRARGFEHALRHPEPRVRRHHLDARHPFGRFAPFARRQRLAFVAVFGVDAGDFGTGAVRKCLRGPQVCEEGTVAGEHGEFRNAALRGFWRVRPGTGVFGRVNSGEGKGAQGDAEVEVGEDKLDAMGSC